MKVSVILLAGGSGTRMRAVIPKQFLPLDQKPIARHSFDVLLAMPEVNQMIVVCDPLYRDHFFSAKAVDFALPGERRQDSVYNGLQLISKDADLVCVHDSARPLITKPLVRRVLEAATIHGAATAGMPLKFTVKETLKGGTLVVSTPDRSLLWEIQTPQVTRPELLKRGFSKAQAEGLTVTDEVSLVELLGLPVKIIEGSYANLKITTPEDLAIAKSLIELGAKLALESKCDDLTKSSYSTQV
ncbi:MAG: 2-C-methyl-D-erythritol 4-phosphate cytidylyltransferase [Parachlamydia sp.]|nr:2-C-methyl-D-erythritol 4-phosphate cytidylyltransferase [Parachlamydia sp.]